MNKITEGKVKRELDVREIKNKRVTCKERVYLKKKGECFIWQKEKKERDI